MPFFAKIVEMSIFKIDDFCQNCQKSTFLAKWRFWRFWPFLAILTFWHVFVNMKNRWNFVPAKNRLTPNYSRFCPPRPSSCRSPKTRQSAALLVSVNNAFKYVHKSRFPKLNRFLRLNFKNLKFTSIHRFHFTTTQKVQKTGLKDF
jgi:hypothetical protein